MGSSGDIQYTPVSGDALQELWTVFRTDSTAQACRNVIASRLVGGGIVFSDKNGAHPDEEFNNHVNKEFVPFLRDILDALMVQVGGRTAPL